MQGRVAVSFVVRKDGSVSNAEISRSVAPSLDAEALRVVQSMPKWTPGKQNGKPVNVKYVVPITFKMDGTEKAGGPNTTDRSNVTDSKTTAGKTVEAALGFDKAKYIVDGKPVTKEQLKELSPDRIESMAVNKKENTIYITLKKE